MIWCCKECVAPKRYPGCHDHCTEYIDQKAKHDKERLEKARLNDIHRREKARARAINCEIRRRNKYQY